jgi:hypothetical protein
MNNVPAVPDKQPGKCPVFIQTVNSEQGKTLRAAIPGNGKDKPSLEQYYGVVKELTATQDNELAEDICRSAVSAMPKENDTARNINTIYQALADFAPQDAIEAKLCLQATALYSQGMQYLSKAERASMVQTAEMFMKFAIKLLRLHNETIEALNRHRRKGEQKVVVQHVNVENGGKAIVGNLIAGEGQKIK